MEQREILFRGFSICTDTCVYGYYIKNYGNEGTIKTEDGSQYTVKHSSVTQYTGLKDSEGQKIFEGDIFNVTDGDGWVVGNHIAKMDADTLGIDERCIEVVIGNVFENPELLSPKDE